MDDYFLSIVKELWPKDRWKVIRDTTRPKFGSGEWREISVRSGEWREISVIGDHSGFECEVNDVGTVMVRRLGHGNYFRSELGDHESIIRSFREAYESQRLGLRDG